MEENIKLRKEIEVLKLMVDKFIFDSQKLQLILNNQNIILNKARISFNPLRKYKFIKNMFARAFHKKYSIVCFKYNKVGHKIFECNINRIGHTFVKQI